MPLSVASLCGLLEFDVTAEATRRQFLGMLSVAGLLTACGGQTESESGAASGDAYPRTVEHAVGSSRIPAAPQRILALYSQDDLDNLLALGVKPLAVAENSSGENTVAPWEGSANDFRYVDMRPEPNIEQIASLRPDLILINDGFFELVGEQLQEIAPTVVYATADPWQDTLAIVGRALALEDAAAELLTTTEARLQLIANDVEQKIGSQTISVVQAYPDGYYGLGPNLVAGGLLMPYGFTFNEAFRDVADMTLSAERLDLLDADVLIVQGDSVEALRAEPVFANLPAVKAGRVLRLSDDELAAASPNAVKVPWAEQNLIPKLVAAFAPR